MWKTRNAYRILSGNLEGKRPLGRTVCNWDDNIKLDLKEIGCECVDCIQQIFGFLNSVR
jgi:hypothetical protein